MTGWDMMDKFVQDKLTELVKKYLDDKALEEMT
jgi:predicted house-cleaning noncanonical NTP pyrophosphatase (MazG superfamily)